jgi:tetratricopeptide (TPR) repeat protein
MDVTEQKLRERYESLETDDLMDLCRTSDLTELASSILKDVLSGRGVEVDDLEARLAVENVANTRESCVPVSTSLPRLGVGYAIAIAIFVYGVGEIMVDPSAEDRVSQGLFIIGFAFVIGLGLLVWNTKAAKLIRAVRLENRGMKHLYSGYHEQAEKMLKRSQLLAEQAVGPEDGELAPITANLAQVYQFQENYKEAERLYKKAITICENARSTTDPFLPLIFNNLAGMYRNQGRDAEAEPLELKSDQIRQANPDYFTENLIGRGIFTQSELVAEPPGWGQHMEAADTAENEDEKKEHLLAALALAEKQGPAGPHLGESLNFLGIFNFERGDFKEAELLFRRAVSVRERAFGEDNESVTQSLTNLAEVYCAQDRETDALQLLDRVLSIMNTNAAEQDTIELATNLNDLGTFYQRLGRFEDAEALYQRALTIHENCDRSHQAGLTTTLRNLVDLYCSQGRYGDAAPLVEEIVLIDESNTTTAPDEFGNDLYVLGVSLFKRGRFEESLTNFSRSLEMFEEIHGPDHPDLIEGMMNYASMLWREVSGFESEAEGLIKRSIAITEQHFGTEHPDLAPCLNELAELYAQQGRDEEAEIFHDRAQRIGNLQ